MNNNSQQLPPTHQTRAGDFWGGLAAMLVALPSSVAFGIVVYTTLGAEYAGQGAIAGLIGAAALGIVTPLCGRTPGLISAPCAPSAAVLSALIAGLLAGTSGARLEPAAILPLVALTALLAAGLQILYGMLGGGKLIKFIPYPVVSGYLSAVGVLIALGQLPKLFGIPRGTPLLQGIMAPFSWKWQGLVVGIVTMAVMALSPRFTCRVPAAILGLFAGVAAYFLLAPFSPELLSLAGNPLVIGPIQASGSLIAVMVTRAESLAQLEAASLKLIVVPALTLSVLLSIDTLKTCVGLDALTRNRHNSNRELIGQGIGNLCSFLLGGMPGAGTMGPTLVNVNSGGRTPRAGVMEGVLVVLALLFLSPYIAWVPIGSLAGILLVIAWRMFDRSIFSLLGYPSGRLDFAVIAGVIVVALTVDLIAASGVGVALAILLFIREQVKAPVIRRKRYLNQMSSKTRRRSAEREILDRYGDQAVFCELQGNLFFGTTDQLFTQLADDLRTRIWLLLDMRHVNSIDYTAVHLFEQMHAQLAERGGQLLFSGMPSALREQRDFERYLAQMGIVSGNDGVLITETRESALEWMEQRIMERAGLVSRNDEYPLPLADFELFRGLDGQLLAMLAQCMRELSLQQGERVFAQGDEGDELFLVQRGSVRVMLPLEGGKRHHLATIGRGGFFGELAFLDRGVRSADVEAKEATELFVLSRSLFDKVSATDAVLEVQVFVRLALAISKRLRQTDLELRILEER
jgi:SulP family sulfate permease